ncbi:hypothetical protein NDU88_008733 [Pleurodeles waltl]|uniref:Ig-like domain-containing protein n=1 Tax=Pleurodeles waltl TaxID=8319 RepID=A0AAV7PQN6_PLEWA|nr:hypothetical protein NDU88_008733 [Pleurodeles waltl]
MFTTGVDMLLFPDCPRLLYFWFLLICSCTGAAPSLKIDQSPPSISVPEGRSVTVNCLITVPGKPQGMNFNRRFRELVYFSETKQVHSRKGNEFEKRSLVSGTAIHTTITLHQLRKNDTDWYMCHSVVIKEGSPVEEVFGGGTLLIVTDAKLAKQSEQSCQLGYTWKWEYTLLIGLAVVILTLCAVIIINKLAIKQNSQFPKKKRVPNTVYEDMTSSIRRNTMTRPLFYSDQNRGSHLVENATSANCAMGNSPHYLQPPDPRHGRASMACSIPPY